MMLLSYYPKEQTLLLPLFLITGYVRYRAALS